MNSIHDQIIEPNVDSLLGGNKDDVGDIIVGCTKFLCESNVALNICTWAVLFRSLVQLGRLSSRGATSSAYDLFLDDEEAAENRQFDSTFSKLTYAHIPPPAASQAVVQHGLYFVSSVVELCNKSPGQYATAIRACFEKEEDAEDAAYLQSILVSANLTIV